MISSVTSKGSQNSETISDAHVDAEDRGETLFAGAGSETAADESAWPDAGADGEDELNKTGEEGGASDADNTGAVGGVVGVNRAGVRDVAAGSDGAKDVDVADDSSG